MQGSSPLTCFEYFVFEGITILSPSRSKSLLPAISKISCPLETIITSSKGCLRSRYGHLLRLKPFHFKPHFNLVFFRNNRRLPACNEQNSPGFMVKVYIYLSFFCFKSRLLNSRQDNLLKIRLKHKVLNFQGR